MKAKLLVLAALACSVVLAQEEDHTVRPFGGMGDIMSHLLQNVEGLTKHAPQQAVVTPNQGFEIEIEMRDDKAPVVRHRLGGGKGHRGGIFGQMMQRMQRMRQRMNNVFNKHRRPFMMGGKGKHGPMGEGPMHGFLRHLINKKMKKAHKKLQRRCAEEMSECPQKRGPGLIDCLLSKQQSLSEDCSEQLHQMRKAHAKVKRKVHRKHGRLLKRVRQVCAQELGKLCPNAGRPLVCLVKQVAKLSVDSRCHKVVQRTANKWGRFELWQARKAQLRTNLKTACGRERRLCRGKHRCPFKLLKCLGKHRRELSSGCSSVVAAEQAKHLAERAQRKALRKAHKACKKTFKAAAKRCGLDSEDESDDETDKQQASSCISTARATKNQCHRDAEKMMASHIKPVVAISTDTDTEPSATVTYRHQIVTSPGDHCLEITIPGGDDSPFWKAEGWKYSAPDRPEWVSGQCDKTKWKSQDAKTDGYDGYTAAKNSPYDAVFLIKYGVEADLMPWLRVNPTLQASSLQAQDTSLAPETPVKNKAVMRAEKRAAHEAREYEVHQDDQALLFALVGMLVVVLFGVVYMALKRRRQRSYALEAMHMSVVQSDAAAVKQESAHDQL